MDGTSNGAMQCGRYDIRPERLDILLQVQWNGQTRMTLQINHNDYNEADKTRCQRDFENIWRGRVFIRWMSRKTKFWVDFVTKKYFNEFVTNCVTISVIGICSSLNLQKWERLPQYALGPQPGCRVRFIKGKHLKTLKTWPPSLRGKCP